MYRIITSETTHNTVTSVVTRKVIHTKLACQRSAATTAPVLDDASGLADVTARDDVTSPEDVVETSDDEWNGKPDAE